jgi:hypothetical protein
MCTWQLDSAGKGSLDWWTLVEVFSWRWTNLDSCDMRTSILRVAAMNTYKVSLRSGQTATIEDQRALSAIAAQLSQEGFVIVQKRSGGYSQGTTEVAYLERAVESIEPAV